jgi:ABC-type bacteriocin/lantibiotic exporter with double-glycine peptidase domain
MRPLKVKHFRQTPNYCGPASLKILLSHYGVEKSEAELARLSGCDHKNGTHHAGMVKVARALGFKAKTFERTSFKDLDAWINKKMTPVIVGWFSEWTDHYSVVVGLDKDYIYLDNPEENKPIQRFKRELFKHLWFDFVGKHQEHVCWGWMMVLEPKKT